MVEKLRLANIDFFSPITERWVQFIPAGAAGTLLGGEARKSVTFSSGPLTAPPPLLGELQAQRSKELNMAALSSSRGNYISDMSFGVSCPLITQRVCGFGPQG